LAIEGRGSQLLGTPRVRGPHGARGQDARSPKWNDGRQMLSLASASTPSRTEPGPSLAMGVHASRWAPDRRLLAAQIASQIARLPIYPALRICPYSRHEVDRWLALVDPDAPEHAQMAARAIAPSANLALLDMCISSASAAVAAELQSTGRRTRPASYGDERVMKCAAAWCVVNRLPPTAAKLHYLERVGVATCPWAMDRARAELRRDWLMRALNHLRSNVGGSLRRDGALHPSSATARCPVPTVGAHDPGSSPSLDTPNTRWCKSGMTSPARPG
jgi:hypothetical protein